MSLLKAGRPSIRKEKALLDVQTHKDTQRLNVNVDREFYKSIKRFALEKDITISDLVIRSVNIYMSNHSHE